MIVEVDIPGDMLFTARRYVDKYFPATKDPHPLKVFTAKDKDLTGLVGELVVATYLSIDWKDYLRGRPINKPDRGWDFSLATGRYDVKALMSVVRPFQGGYFYNVAEFQINTRADGFIFCTLIRGYTKAYLGGYCSLAQFQQKAVFRREGEVDPSNGFRFPCNAYNIHIADLSPVDELKSLIIQRRLL